MTANLKRPILHIVPGASAASTLRRALREAERDDDVLAFGDDLSCGPIDPDDLAVRAAWWTPFKGMTEEVSKNRAFWDRVEATGNRLVVWFGRHASMELAFFLSLADRLRGRSFDVVDVTGRQFPFVKGDRTPAMTPPAQAVGMLAPDGFKSLLGRERPITPHEKEDARRHWHQLKRENAPFRVVTAGGLASAPTNYFDPLLMEGVTSEWRKVVHVIGDTMGHDLEPYWQVGDMMLLTRVVALIEEGRLLAKGDPWDMRSCLVRLPA